MRVGIETASGFRVRRLAPNAGIFAAGSAYLQRHPAPRTLQTLPVPARHGTGPFRWQLLKYPGHRPSPVARVFR
ncbi:hypothetical protein A8E81_24155 [Burkholderia cenocepacia]|nr:hypothetical protein A8E75_24760 [Burkholderia cenocepacia]ONV19721.1 hypothetical protein A8E74_22100 [Burkholderia cenocepacia]ONV23697.1 hypothetical protein A8E78_29975 [Burkholderia cenocepacia]ONV24413.1 hypothetical protein A8E77_28680 [Burkholderia cenocepacia]ONV35680.1 hypothetical protein A8E82_29650 [Burkholderia cenocepacia]